MSSERMVINLPFGKRAEVAIFEKYQYSSIPRNRRYTSIETSAALV